jgi:hypothetical protein
MSFVSPYQSPVRQIRNPLIRPKRPNYLHGFLCRQLESILADNPLPIAAPSTTTLQDAHPIIPMRWQIFHQVVYYQGYWTPRFEETAEFGMLIPIDSDPNEVAAGLGPFHVGDDDIAEIRMQWRDDTIRQISEAEFKFEDMTGGTILVASDGSFVGIIAEPVAEMAPMGPSNMRSQEQGGNEDHLQGPAGYQHANENEVDQEQMPRFMQNIPELDHFYASESGRMFANFLLQHSSAVPLE